MEEQKVKVSLPQETDISLSAIVQRLAVSPPGLPVQWVQRDFFSGVQLSGSAVNCVPQPSG